jgi:hypothetical protein
MQICFEKKMILDIKEKFLAKFVFLEKKAKIMGKSKACENSSFFFFVIAFF